MHIFWLWLFVTYLEFGINGVPVAMIVTETLKIAIIFIYARCLPQLSEALFFPTSDAFSGWPQYLKLALPSILMMCPEWWAFEVLTILSGLVGVNEQAVMVIAMNIVTILEMPALGFSEAAATVVGNSMGENDPALAKRYLRVSSFVSLPVIYFFASMTFLFRPQIASLYFEDGSELQIMLADVLKIVCLESVFDHSQVFLQGPIRAISMQFPASIISIICNVVISLSLGIFFTFKL
jgi:MATE family multidrug resistance protein